MTRYSTSYHIPDNTSSKSRSRWLDEVSLDDEIPETNSRRLTYLTIRWNENIKMACWHSICSPYQWHIKNGKRCNCFYKLETRTQYKKLNWSQDHHSQWHGRPNGMDLKLFRSARLPFGRQQPLSGQLKCDTSLIEWLKECWKMILTHEHLPNLCDRSKRERAH